MAILNEKIVISAEDRASGVLNKVGGSVDKLTTSITSGLGPAIVAYFSVQKVKQFAEYSIKAFQEEEKALIRLSTALKVTNQNSNGMYESFLKLADELKKSSTYSDDQIYAAEAQGIAYGIAADKIDDYVKGAIGLSEIMGGDMEQALAVTAKAFQGNYETLGRQYIPAIMNAKTEAEKMALVQQKMAEGLELNAQRLLSGQGQWDKFKQTLEDIVAEPVGGLLTKELTTWAANFKAIGDIMKVRELDAQISGLEDAQKRIINAIKANEKKPVFGFDVAKETAKFEAYAALVRKYDEQRLILLGIKEAPKIRAAGPTLPGAGTGNKEEQERLAKEAADREQKLLNQRTGMIRYFAEIRISKNEEMIKNEEEAAKRMDRINQWLADNEQRRASERQALQSARLMAYSSLTNSFAILGQQWESKELASLAVIGEQVLSVAQLYITLGATKGLSKGLIGFIEVAAVVAAGATIINQMKNIYGGMKNTSGGGGGSISMPSTPAYSGYSGGSGGGETNYVTINGIVTDEVWRIITRTSLSKAFRQEALRGA